jgi:redox-sensitive bicupin YhaK (pirin superfamily)
MNPTTETKSKSNIELRPSGERGTTDFGWLKSRHSFSFGEYYDPRHHQFGPLRVINEDRVAGGGGFPTHPHRDMEIFSYVVEGELEHRDSLGHRARIGAGGVQRITAGRGIAHSETNPSAEKPVHFLQIWIRPRAERLEPSYADRHFPREEKLNRLRPLLSPDGREGSLTLAQDAVVYGSVLEPGHALELKLKSGRQGWLQVVKGRLTLEGRVLAAGDAAGIKTEGRHGLQAEQETELLWMDWPLE